MPVQPDLVRTQSTVALRDKGVKAAKNVHVQAHNPFAILHALFERGKSNIKTASNFHYLN